MNYLVDALNGNDNNDGISSPWKTLGKVNGHHFQAGDVIRFHVGRAWNEKLIIPTSGVTGNPIIFDSYGSGPTPIINFGAYPAIDVNNKFNVTIKNLQIQNTTNVGIFIRNNSNHIRIESVRIKNPKAIGILIEDSPACTIYNNTLELYSDFAMKGSFIFARNISGGINISYNKAVCNGHLNTSNGVFVHDTSAALIHHNTFRNATTGIGVNAIARNVIGALVYNNAVYATNGSHGDGEAIEFTGNTSHTVSGVMRHNLVVKGSNSGYAGVHTENCDVFCNIVLGWVATGIHWSSHCINTRIYNNTVWDNKYGILFDPDCSGDIKNNIIMGSTAHGIAAQGADCHEDYNIFWRCNPNNIPNGAHSRNVDPLIYRYPPYDGPNDCKLKPGSPAINSGIDLGSEFQNLFDPSGALFPYSTMMSNNRGAFGNR